LTHPEFSGKIQAEDTERDAWAASVSNAALEGCPWSYGRLVSLMDVLKFGAERFVSLTRQLAEMRTTAKHNASAPISGGYTLDTVKADEVWLKAMDDAVLDGLADNCQSIGLSVSLEFLKTVRAECVSRTMTITEWTLRLGTLQEVVEQELKTVVLLHIPKEKVGRYENPRKGWEAIINRFPNAVGDIEEMGKSFALSRYTAAVFHSVQVIEVGLIELGKFLGVNDPLSGWTSVATALKQIVDKKHPARTAFERDNFPVIEQLQGTVEALKNAWRNKVSHAHGKLVIMGADFNEEIAEEILMATRALMRRLTEDLPGTI
jgi:hypothetical protein